MAYNDEVWIFEDKSCRKRDPFEKALSFGVLVKMGDLEKQERVLEEAKEEEEKEGLLGGMAVLDFDLLCSTVALQTQGKWRKLETAGDVEDGGESGGVLRMWEGELLDCFDDRRIALESVW